MWKGLFMALLLLSLTFALPLEEGQVRKTAVSIVKVPVTDTEEPGVQFYIFVFEGAETDLRTLPDYNERTQQYLDRFAEEYAENPDQARQEILRQAVAQVQEEYTENPPPESLQNVPVTVYYFNVNGRQRPLPGCTDIRTTRGFADADGNVLGYYALCEVPRDPVETTVREDGTAVQEGGYIGTCTRYLAAYAGEEGRNRASSFSVEACDQQLIALPAFSQQLADVLRDETNAAAMFAAFVLLGLLLATMYFSGRSPLTLLDVATPRLPSPKSIIPSGQILGPFGYTELKKAIGKLQKTDNAVMAKELRLRGANLRGSMVFIDRIANSMRFGKADKWAGEVEVTKNALRSMGILAAEYRMDISRLRHFENMEFHELHTNQEKQRELGRLLGDLERRVDRAQNERDILYFLTLKRVFQSIMSLRVLEVLTGHDKIEAKRVMPQQAVQTALRASLNQYLLLRPLVSGSWDSVMRSFWQFGRFGRAVGRETARQSTDAYRAMRRKAAAAGWVQMAEEKPREKAIKDMVMGGMVPTDDRLAAFYHDFRAEINRDMQRYVLGQLLARYNVHLRMTEEELISMGHKDLDVVGISGLRGAMHDPAFLELEKRMREILGNGQMSEKQKLDELMNLAQQHGINLGKNIYGIIERMEQIHADKAGDHIKMLDLYATLQEGHGINQPASVYWRAASPNEYHVLVGRDEIPHDMIWKQNVLRNFIYNLEHGFTDYSLQHSMEFMHLFFVNRLGGLLPSQHEAKTMLEEVGRTPFPLLRREGVSGKGLPDVFPEYMRKGEFSAIEHRMARYVIHSLTPEGRKSFKEATGHEADETAIDRMGEKQFQAFYKALIDHTLYSYKWVEAKYKVGKGSYGEPLLGGVEKETGAVHWWESPHEFGPDKKWHVGDMKRHWVGVPGQDFTLYEFAEKRFEKSQLGYYKAGIERELDQMQFRTDKERQQAYKKLLIRDMFFHDIQDMSNSIYSHNAYGTTNNYMRSLSNDVAGFLRAAMKERGIPEPRLDRGLSFREHDPSNAMKVQDLANLLRVHDADFRAYLKRPVYYDTIAKSDMAWVMKHEGGFVPWHPGTLVSDRDRVFGYFAIHDPKSGQWRRWDPDTQKIDFRGAQARGIQLDKEHKCLQAGQRIIKNEDGSEYHSVLNPPTGRDVRLDNKDPRAWKDFFTAAKEWAGDDYKRMRTFYGALWHYAQMTEDWQGFWAEKEHISVKPKREVAPLPPTIWRFISDREMPSWLEHLTTKGRNAGLEVGNSISRVWQETAKDLTYSSYAVSHYTEALRQTSWRLAEHIKRADWSTLAAGDPMLAQLYQDAANAHPEYHQIWDYSIDRNPQRMSTSYGSRHRWGTYFHYGPYEQYERRATFRATMNRSEYFTTVALTWPMEVARWFSKYYTTMFRSTQEAFMGSAGKWDTRESALKRWEHTPPRLMEAMRAMLNPFAARSGRDVIFKNPSVHRDMSGPRLGGGLKVAPQDMNWVTTGMYSEARTGAANPGVSYYNYRYSLVPSTVLAEYMVYRAPHAAFFENDPYLKKYALVSTTKREVDSLAFSLERERELRGFGMSTNPIWGWAGLPWFYYHGAGGILPSWMTPKDMITQGVQQFKRGGLKSPKETLISGMQSFFHGATSLGRHLGHPGQEIYVTYCPKCNKPGYRLGSGMAGAGICSSRECRWRLL